MELKLTILIKISNKSYIKKLHKNVENSAFRNNVKVEINKEIAEIVDKYIAVVKENYDVVAIILLYIHLCIYCKMLFYNHHILYLN